MPMNDTGTEQPQGAALHTADEAESEGETYQHLERRPHRWRRQLSLKGRNITVGQFVYTMRASGWDAAEAAQQYGLPAAAAKEAVAYYQQHQDLVDGEAEEETRWLIEKGYLRELPPLP